MVGNLRCISFDVECISEETCRNCEELEIVVGKNMLYADDNAIGCENYLYCTHAQSCGRLLNRLKKVAESNEQGQEEI